MVSAKSSSDVPMEVRRPLHQELLGTSNHIKEIRTLLAQISGSDLSVLITGETGTGKDLVARMIHNLSPRKDRPFVKLNCPAIPDELFESELFGHERGAFTGATNASPGRLERAHGGTLFLDEFAEISAAAQSKFLAVLDGESFMRIGGTDPILTDVRIVAATNVPIEEGLRQGLLSEAAVYKLSEIQVHLKPLRERMEDIPVLAEHFNYHFAGQFGKMYEPIPSGVLEQMLAHQWPGNIRELAACVREYLISGYIDLMAEPARASHLAVPDTVADPKRTFVQSGRTIRPMKEVIRETVEATEQSLITEALEYTRWNRRKAADLLQISYSSLLRRIDYYRIGHKAAQSGQ